MNRGHDAATLYGVEDDELLATLARILDDYCELAGRQGSHLARAQLTRRLAALLQVSIDPAHVRRELDDILADLQADFRTL